MIISEAHFRREGTMSRLQARILTAAGKRRDQVAHIDVQGEVEMPAALGDPFLAACLIPAMFQGEDLEVCSSVSARLAGAVPRLQEIFRGWYPEVLQPIRVVTARVLTDSGADRPGTACFFSGGVDSWYSVLKHRSRISGLITVKGFDIPKSDTTIWPTVLAANRKSAFDLGLPLWVIETNLRECLDPVYPGLGRQYDGDSWGEFLHGSFLAAAGLTLQAHFDTVLVPSTSPYATLHPWGSHPLTDPLWSTGRTRFVHDGCESNRVRKLEVLATSASGCLEQLRVCPA